MNKTRTLNILLITLVFLTGIIGTASAVTVTTTSSSIATNSTVINYPATTINNNEIAEIAPIQYNVKQAIKNNKILINDIEGIPEYSTKIIEKTKNSIKILSTTRVIFKNPRGAGFDNNWETIGNKTIENKIKAAVVEDIQKNILDKNRQQQLLQEWNNYNFNTGKRMYVYSETYEVTNISSAIVDNLATAVTTSNTKNINAILMGFTINTPHINYTITKDLYIPLLFWNAHIASMKAGIEFYAAFGLRLPALVTLYMPNKMFTGTSYYLNTSIQGLDWTSSDYKFANVFEGNGNEFVANLYFFVGFKLWLIGLGNFGPFVETNIDYGRSFKTPIGTNERFPLTQIRATPDETGLKKELLGAYVGIGLKLSPDISTDKITAKWIGSGDLSGSGDVVYKRSNINYTLGPLKAGNYDKETSLAKVKLYDYKYYFSVCKISLKGYLRAGFLDIGTDSNDFQLYSIGCNDLTKGLYLSTHDGTTANNVIATSNVSPSSIALPLASTH